MTTLCMLLVLSWKKSKMSCVLILMILRDGFMTPNAGKCHFMCLGKDTLNETFIFKNLVMKNSKEQKKLRVTAGSRQQTEL